MYRGLLLVERSCLEFLAGVSIEFRYVGCVDENRGVDPVLKGGGGTGDQFI